MCQVGKEAWGRRQVTTPRPRNGPIIERLMENCRATEGHIVVQTDNHRGRAAFSVKLARVNGRDCEEAGTIGFQNKTGVTTSSMGVGEHAYLIEADWKYIR